MKLKFKAFQDGKILMQDGYGIYNTKKFLDKLYEDAVLMQFTGLRDKKGVDIYECDIVKYSAIHDKKCSIIYDKKLCRFVIKTPYGGDSTGLTIFNCKEVEVISNLYIKK